MGTNKEATVIVLDIGRGMATSSTPTQTYFDRAQAIMQRILLRKILSDGTDELGFITFGSEKTKNRLSEEYVGEYQNIETEWKVQLPTWAQYDRVTGLRTTEADSDWYDALVVAVDFLKESTESRNFREKKIVILSNFASEIELGDVSVVQSAIQSQKIQVAFIGPCQPGVANFVEGLPSGVVMSLSEAEEDFKYYSRKRKMKRLTKCSLQIGSKVHLPLRWLKLNMDETRYKWTHAVQRRTIMDRPVPPTASLPTSNLSNVEFDVDNDVKTRFGTTPVTLTYADMEAIKDRSDNVASLVYFGAVRSSAISRAMLINDSLYGLIPDGTKRSQVLFQAFVQGLLAQNKFGFARRIPTNKGRIHLGILYPVSDELGQALYFLKVPFADWIKTVPYVPLPEPTDSKLNSLVDAVIDKMTLNCTHQDLLIPDPNFQLKSELIYRRAIGDETLSKDHFPELFNPHTELKLGAAATLRQIEKSYPIEKPAELRTKDPVPPINPELAQEIDAIREAMETDVDNPFEAETQIGDYISQKLPNTEELIQ